MAEKEYQYTTIEEFINKNSHLLKEWLLQEYLKNKEEYLKQKEIKKQRKCNRCGKYKYIWEFTWLSKYCNNCIKEKKKEWIIKRKQSINKYLSSNKWKLYKKNKDNNYRWKKKSTSDWSINSKYLQELFKKQEWKCNICWIELLWIEYHLDHIYPLSKWWEHKKDNIQFLCRQCNILKSNKI